MIERFLSYQQASGITMNLSLVVENSLRLVSSLFTIILSIHMDCGVKVERLNMKHFLHGANSVALDRGLETNIYIPALPLPYS
jgi:hypothetical protein